MWIGASKVGAFPPIPAFPHQGGRGRGYQLINLSPPPGWGRDWVGVDGGVVEVCAVTLRWSTS